MNKPFIHSDFLLQTKAAQELYHTYAHKQPIIDYHCHLPPQEIADDINFKNLTHIWLNGDHYKWRAMRACGVDEYLITGKASDKDKFLKWAETVPKTIKNPLYHWTHLELQNTFGINDRLLNEETAESIWEECNEMLQQPDFTTKSLLKKNKVELVGTTDDPTDNLKYHQQLKDSDDEFEVIPTFRPDRGMAIEDQKSFKEWVDKLEELANVDISTYEDFLDAIKQRHDFFDSIGARASDHGSDRPYGNNFTKKEVAAIFDKVLSGRSVTDGEIHKFRSAFLYYCGVMDAEKGWVFQLHIGAIRNTNTRMMNKIGKDAGFDSIGDVEMAGPLAQMLDRLDSEDNLPRTILYNSNPRDNELMATMIGNYQDGSIAGKMQHGPSWWFLDQKEGIEAQITSLANMGVLSQFIGMTTDSRSFLSYPRHEYFRRILCNMLGDDIEKGLLPNDLDLIGGVVEDICYNNAKEYFQL